MQNSKKLTKVRAQVAPIDTGALPPRAHPVCTQTRAYPVRLESAAILMWRVNAVPELHTTTEVA